MITIDEKRPKWTNCGKNVCFWVPKNVDKPNLYRTITGKRPGSDREVVGKWPGGSREAVVTGLVSGRDMYLWRSGVFLQNGSRLFAFIADVKPSTFVCTQSYPCL